MDLETGSFTCYCSSENLITCYKIFNFFFEESMELEVIAFVTILSR